jgi:hypothetical protein
MMENPYTVRFSPAPVSEAGLGKQLPENRVIPKRRKLATAILKVRFLIRHRALQFHRELGVTNVLAGFSGL